MQKYERKKYKRTKYYEHRLGYFFTPAGNTAHPSHTLIHISIFSSYELIFKKIVIPSLALNAMHWEGDSPVA